jgi:hypothetical protein
MSSRYEKRQGDTIEKDSARYSEEKKNGCRTVYLDEQLWEWRDKQHIKARPC